jgi:hypothetical protein
MLLKVYHLVDERCINVLQKTIFKGPRHHPVSFIGPQTVKWADEGPFSLVQIMITACYITAPKMSFILE